MLTVDVLKHVDDEDEHTTRHEGAGGRLQLAGGEAIVQNDVGIMRNQHPEHIALRGGRRNLRRWWVGRRGCAGCTLKQRHPAQDRRRSTSRRPLSATATRWGQGAPLAAPGHHKFAQQVFTTCAGGRPLAGGLQARSKQAAGGQAGCSGPGCAPP